jgi:hypothetical protein
MKAGEPRGCTTPAKEVEAQKFSGGCPGARAFATHPCTDGSDRQIRKANAPIMTVIVTPAGPIVTAQ